MATTTNYGWTTPDDTALVKDGAAAIRTLGSSVDTTTKALNPSTTLGDIEYRSSTANTNTRLGIGTTGQVLTVSGGVPAWAAVSGGGMTLLSTTALSTSSTTVSITGTGYIGLFITVTGFTMSGADQVRVRFNGDTGSNYRWSGVRYYQTNAANLENYDTSGIISSYLLAATQTNSVYQIYIPASQDTSSFKMGSFELFGPTASSDTNEGGQFIYKSTSVISSFTFGSLTGATFSAGSIKVYGVK